MEYELKYNVGDIVVWRDEMYKMVGDDVHIFDQAIEEFILWADEMFAGCQNQSVGYEKLPRLDSLLDF